MLVLWGAAPGCDAATAGLPAAVASHARDGCVGHVPHSCMLPPSSLLAYLRKRRRSIRRRRRLKLEGSNSRRSGSAERDNLTQRSSQDLHLSSLPSFFESKHFEVLSVHPIIT